MAKLSIEAENGRSKRNAEPWGHGGWGGRGGHGGGGGWGWGK